MKPNLRDLKIDFIKGAVGFRRRRSSLKSELISKAVGAKKGLRILDGTVGLGTDAFVLASLGYEVTALEKDHALYEVLYEALMRAKENADTSEAAARIQLINQDFREYIKTSKSFDAIYLDPMFPEKSKSSLPKKEMQILQAHLGIETHESAEELLRVALESKVAARVVIKRPLAAALLVERPLIQFKGKSVRFDVYNVQLKSPQPILA